MKHKMLMSAFILGVFGLFMGLSCCDDCPTCPKKPEPPPLGKYRIFSFNSSYKRVVAIDTPADTVVNITQLDFYGYGVFAVPGGDRLLITNTDTRKMQVMDTRSFELTEELDLYGDYFFDKSDNYGIVSSFENEKTYRIDPVTLSPVDSVPLVTYHGYLDTLTNSFWGTICVTDSSGLSCNMILNLDCDDFSNVDTLFLDTSIWVVNVAYSWRTNDLYMQGGKNGFPVILCHDIDSEITEVILYFTFQIGGLRVSPDGRYVYITDSGDGSHGIFPTGYIYIIDTETRQLYDVIPPIVYPAQEIGIALWGEMLITPDTRRLYVASNRNAWGTMPIAVVDLYENKIIKAILPFNNFWGESLALVELQD
ncbi:MAG: hypothetical protein CVT49_07580 [candidate division Zixibacteria bacterium HGW-Zixibacteria-1]|nr:MAG: hypothetical protein CVT49_07580 [candidate division Zixibacteria bacterium HGW-Zixibacteria-1]